MGKTYPDHKGNYYYRNHTSYHIVTLDPLGLGTFRGKHAGSLFCDVFDLSRSKQS